MLCAHHTRRFAHALVALCFAGAIADAASAQARALEPVRLIHQRQQQTRERVWLQLFPEGPTLVDSVIFLKPALDDLFEGSHLIEVTDRNDGTLLAAASFTEMMNSGGQAIVTFPSGEELPFATTSQSAALVAGSLTGPSGEERFLVAMRFTIFVESLSLIAPVQETVFVPMQFTRSLAEAESMVIAAGAAIGTVAVASADSGADPDADVDHTRRPEAASECAENFDACLAAAWNLWMLDVAGAWEATGISSGACLEPCFAFASDCEFACHVRACLLQCGLADAAAGGGGFTHTWAAHEFSATDCSILRNQCERAGTQPGTGGN